VILASTTPGCREGEPHEVGRVLGDDGLDGWILTLADVLDQPDSGLARLTPRLPDRARERNRFRDERERNRSDRERKALGSARFEQAADPIADREHGAGDKNEDRGKQRPEETLLPIAKRMLLVRRP
jgi:hypothetical protein